MLGPYQLSSFLIIYKVCCKIGFTDSERMVGDRQTMLSTYGERMINKAELRSRRHGIKPIDHYKYELTDGHVGGVVDLETNTCTCK